LKAGLCIRRVRFVMFAPDLRQHRRCQAGKPLIELSEFPEPALFVGGSGLKIRLFGGSGTADPSGALRANRYHGITTTAGITTSYPVIRSRQQSLSVFGTAELLDNEIFTGDPARQTSRDNLRVLRAGTEYARQDTWLGAERSAVSTAAIRISRGLDTLGASPSNPVNVGRQNQLVEFTKVNM